MERFLTERIGNGNKNNDSFVISHTLIALLIQEWAQTQYDPREAIMNLLSALHIVTVAALVGSSFLLISSDARAEEVPLSHIADPDVYEVIAESDTFRVIVATWQPGQQDAFHSHPANAAYRLTDCKNRILKLDGSIAREGEVRAGSVVLQNPVPGHSFKNMSEQVCQTLIVESK